MKPFGPDYTVAKITYSPTVATHQLSLYWPHYLSHHENAESRLKEDVVNID